jgi:outer membrane protein OmpA-like peptidoglycan-associated protein
MVRLLLASAASALLIAGCASDYDSDSYRGDQPWRMTRVANEYDYEVLDAVLFRSDSANLSDGAAGVIADLAREVRHYTGSMIVVDGYTDTTGTPEGNLDLSHARAERVSDALTHDGVNDRRIETHGFGQTHLAVPTSDDVSEPRNRRIVIRMINPA